jgi:phage RecT family recombinase
MAQENRGQSTAVAVTEKSIGEQLVAWLPNLQKYAVRKYDADNWIKTAMLCVLESKDIQELLATKAGQASLYHALRYAASTGLSLNPQEGKAALVPIQGKVNYWIMKNGWVDLLMDTGKVARATSFVVYLADVFEIEITPQGDSYKFRPNLDDRGAVRGFCSSIVFADGTTSVHWMTKKQVEDHRDQFSKMKGPGSAWATAFEGRALAACVKQHIRRLALGTADIVEGDDEPEPVRGWDDAPGTSAEELERRVTETVAEKPAAVAAAEGKGSPAAKADGGLF